MAGVNDWRLIRRNPVTGVEEWYRYNGDGTVTIRETQDVERILDHNQASANHSDGWDEEKIMRRAARVPLVILNDFQRKGLNLLRPENIGELKKLLNNPDYAKLRTARWTV